MKILPSNQTLILANERGTASLQPLLTDASGAVLKRVTIMAAQPDSTLLYVQAEYADAADDQDAPSTVARRAAALPPAESAPRTPDPAGRNPSLEVSSATTAGVHPGIALYSSTLRNLGPPLTARLDVRA